MHEGASNESTKYDQGIFPQVNKGTGHHDVPGITKINKITISLLYLSNLSTNIYKNIF